MKPKKWTAVYPHGTKDGDEEMKFFISLARNQKYQWRSTSAIAKETGLSRERVEEIIKKYYKKGMVFQNPKNEDQWGYWERVPEMLAPDPKTLGQKDQDGRIDKNLGKSNDSCYKNNDQNDSPTLQDAMVVYKLQYGQQDDPNIVCHMVGDKKYYTDLKEEAKLASRWEMLDAPFHINNTKNKIVSEFQRKLFQNITWPAPDFSAWANSALQQQHGYQLSYHTDKAKAEQAKQQLQQ